MRLITHDKLVNRNVLIGKYSFGAGMVLLVGAFLINLYAFSRPNDALVVFYALGAFLFGFTLTNIGTVFQNRWGRRPDKGLADALKGLDDRFTLYNYRLGSPHVFVGPGGVFVLVPKFQPGPISYDGKRWQAPGAPRGFMGLFNADPLGNPVAEAAAEVDSLARYLKRHAPEIGIVPQALVVFMSPRAEVSAKDAPIPALHVKKLKEYVRRLPKGPTLSAQAQAELEQKLGIAPG